MNSELIIMNDKIENNPSNKKFKEEIQGAKGIKFIASILSPFSKTAKNVVDVMKDFDKIEEEFNTISKSPDLFNHYFGDLGWIAHESINHTLMLECIDLAKNNQIKLAEEKLANYYTTKEMHWLVRMTYGTPEFRKRNELINLAYEDTINERFYSAVLILLTIIDGSVNDIDKQKGFFTETTDLTAWDSIAGHSSGLSKLRDILNSTRKSTNEDEIFLPYRNGILHGRDINYNNKYVAGKLWLTLFAINDWVRALKKNKENAKKEVKQKTFYEILSDYQKWQVRKEEMDEKMDLWKHREIILNENIPTKGNIDDYEDFTPEKDAIRLMIYWKRKNYGEIAKLIAPFSKEFNFKKEAGRVRQVFEGKDLKNYEIVSIEHLAPAIAEIKMKVDVSFQEKEYTKEIMLRLIYQNEDGETMVFGQKGGKWKFVDAFFFSKIEYIEYD